MSSPLRPTSAPPIDLSGAWKGAFCWDLMVELADLTLSSSPDHRTLTGEMHFAPIPNATLFRGRTPPETVWTISGRVDPGTGAVWLAPPPAPPRTTIGPVFEQQPLGAVFSAARNELAGQFRNPYQLGTANPEAPYFLFVRGDAAARLKTLAEHASTAVPPLRPSGGSTPDMAAIAKWLGPLEAEFGKNVAVGGVEQIADRAMPILADASFVPVFGAPYDAIDVGSLVAAARVGGGVRPDPQFQRDHGYLQWALAPSPSRIVRAAAMRAIDAWEAETLARFRSGTPVASAFEDLAAAQEAIHDRIVYAWPSAKKNTDDEIERIRGTLSGSSLGANVDAAIAGAAGIEGAKKLASWAKDNAGMLQRLSPDERAAAQAKIDAKLDELLQAILAPKVAEIAKLGAGEPAVRAGAAWYKAIVDQLGFASGRPPFAQAVAQVAARRDADMTAGTPQYLQRIQACKTPEEVDAMLASELSVPGDEKSKAHAAIADAAGKRKQKIEEERILSLFSREEQEIMDRPGHLDLTRAKPRKPTPEEVRLAMVRGWAFGTGKMLDAHRARYVDIASSKVMFIPFPVILTFSQEDLLRADPVGKSGDYECEFQILMQMAGTDDNMLLNYDEVVRKQSVHMLELVNGFCIAMSADPQTKVLRLTEHGWVIPELMEAGAIQGTLEHALHVR
jgi:hypothetical protein